MKKIIIAVVTSLLAFLLCSCEKTDSYEIKNRYIVQGIGIDKAQDGGLTVSFQLINTDAASVSSAQDSPEKPTKCYSVYASSVSQAVSLLSNDLGKRLLLNQNRILIFGRSFAQDGIGRVLDEFLRNTESRFTVLCAVSDKTASEIIFAQLGKNIVPAVQCEEMLSAGDAYTVETELYQAVNCIYDGRRDFALPLLSLSRNEEAEKINCTGTVLFYGDRAVGTVSRSTSFGINLLLKKQSSGIIDVKVENSTVSYEIVKTKPEIICVNTEGKPTFELRLKARLKITEISTEKGAADNAPSLEALSAAAEDALKSSIEKSVTECIIKASGDTLGLADIYNKTAKSKARVDNKHLKSFDTKITVKISIVNSGDFSANLYGGRKYEQF